MEVSNQKHQKLENYDTTETEQKIHSENDTQTFSKKVEDLKLENEKLKEVVNLYDQAFAKIAPKMEATVIEYQKRVESMIEERSRHLEEINDLEKVYRSNLKRYNELRIAILEQRSHEEDLLCTNKALKSNLEEISERISELVRNGRDLRNQRETEIAQLQAALKLDAVKIEGFEKSVADLTYQKQELTTICEELINRHS